MGKSIMKIHSHIKNGKPIQNRGDIQKAYDSNEGKNITITINRRKEKRSNDFNAYYWGVVVKMIKMAIDDTGDVVTINDVHDLLRGKFNTKQFGLIEVPQSSANLSTPAFATYVERCRFWANDFFNIEIPDPGEEITDHIDPDFNGGEK